MEWVVPQTVIKNERARGGLGALCVLLALLFGSAPARANNEIGVSDLLRNLAVESMPAAFAPAPFESEDFSIDWSGRIPDGAKVFIAPHTLQWSRMSDVLVLPRARVVIDLENVKAAKVLYAGLSRAFTVDASGHGHTEIEAALISGPDNLIDVMILRDGHPPDEARLQIRFTPRKSLKRPFRYYDSSCSRFAVKIEPVSPIEKGSSEDAAAEATGDHWMYVGCQIVHERGQKYNTSSLVAVLFWDGVGNVIHVNGAPVRSAAPGVWNLSLPPGQNVILRTTDAPAREMKVSYAIPEHDHLAFVGLGLGPYSYTIEGAGLGTNRIIPLATFYGGYLFTDTTRATFFAAATLHKQFFSDFGLYLNTQQIKALDNRLIGNLMLGAHVMGFRAQSQNYARFSAPQGLELIFKDFLKPNYNLMFGGFIYPPINNRMYNNVWLRWGNPRFFGEINYISWRERIGVDDEIPLYSRSVGLSFGMPLAFFL